MYMRKMNLNGQRGRYTKSMQAYCICKEGTSEVVYSSIYCCRGVAADQCDYNHFDTLYIEETQVHYSDDLPNPDISYYSARSYGTCESTEWYETYEEAEIQAKKLGFKSYKVVDAFLNTTVIDKDPRLDFEVTLRVDNEGRIFTRINMHPEMDGMHFEGKLFYAEKSFNDARPGTAIVKVSRETPEYGFFVGRMK